MTKDDPLAVENVLEREIRFYGFSTAPVTLENFRHLQGSKATGASNMGRLTNLMQLTVDTTWWTRYRSRNKNPDFGDVFPNAVPSIGVGQHTAIPRDDDDVQPGPVKHAVPALLLLIN